MVWELVWRCEAMRYDPVHVNWAPGLFAFQSYGFPNHKTTVLSTATWRVLHVRQGWSLSTGDIREVLDISPCSNYRQHQLLWLSPAGSLMSHTLHVDEDLGWQRPKRVWGFNDMVVVEQSVPGSFTYTLCTGACERELFSLPSRVSVRRLPCGQFEVAPARSADHPYLVGVRASISNGCFRLHLGSKRVLCKRALVPEDCGHAYDACAWLKDGSGVCLWTSRMPERSRGLVTF